ncbi:MATE family efflux transporter [Thomasclavelia ramosa]|uniref:MATE family efflux transporter n=1 Tax=Thomasclavelia ramosa TaxID=1547 RepID=UPI000E51EBF4|nr:MATE family efflux transporter [Thomasclavelia ramosa]RGQ39943.1 MATE family efflux transporter [Thomasclavelia ramosa]RGQ55623.1 MATE family efflux transporter [Thomasclavelia ramosa]
MFSNKALKKLILPLIIEQILIMAVGVADTVMVSYAGEVAISGVGLVDMFNNLIITVLAAIDAGGAIIVSQYIGNKDRKNANKASSQLLTITIVIATVIMLGCLVFHRILLSTFFGAIEMDVMKAATTYFLISAISFPFLGVYNSAAALYRSMEKTRTTMYVSILMNIINVVGNYIGVFILHAGVAGVAVPTLISRIVAAIIMFALSLNSSNLVYVKIKNVFAWNQEMISRILKIAVPNGIENGLFTLGRVLVTSIVALFGTSQIAANSVAGSIDQITVVVVNAINLGIVVVVGQCIGANDYEQAKYYIKKLMKISYIVTGIIGSAVILLLPWILNLYSLSSEARNLTFILVIMHNIMATALHPTAFVLPNGLRAAGDVKFSMVVGIVSMILFRLGAAVLFGIIFNLGIIGVWIAMGSDWLCRSVCFVIRFIKGKWRQFKVI